MNAPQPQGQQRCEGESSCYYGALDGAVADGARPLIVWSSTIAVPVRPEDGPLDRDYWPSWDRSALPIEGEFVLRIDTAYSAEFVGRVGSDQAGLVWAVDQIDDFPAEGLGLSDVLLVDSWLAGSQANNACPELVYSSTLNFGECGELAWLQGSDYPSAAPPSGSISLQSGGYSDYTRGPSGGKPAGGIFVLAPRLEWDGCAAAPCRDWEVVGQVNPTPDVSGLGPIPEPTPFPTDGWTDIDSFVWGFTTFWSPDSRWLMQTEPSKILLLDGDSGDIVQTWTTPAGDFSRGAMWLDSERFISVFQPLNTAEVHDDLAPALMGRVGVDELTDIAVPVGYEDDEPFVDMRPNGRGAIAFTTTHSPPTCPLRECWTYRVWTTDRLTAEHDGLPIAWSPSGDRLAVIHSSRHAGGKMPIGAGPGGPPAGWLEVVSWPGLDTVFADEHAIVDSQDVAFDPSGRYLASRQADLVRVDTVTGKVSHMESESRFFAWDEVGQLAHGSDDGDVVVSDANGNVVDSYVGAGQWVVSSRDGSTWVAVLRDERRAAPFGLFTIIRDGATSRVALPHVDPDAFIYEPLVSPDGTAMVVPYNRYRTTESHIWFRVLDQP